MYCYEIESFQRNYKGTYLSYDQIELRPKWPVWLLYGTQSIHFHCKTTRPISIWRGHVMMLRSGIFDFLFLTLTVPFTQLPDHCFALGNNQLVSMWKGHADVKISFVSSIYSAQSPFCTEIMPLIWIRKQWAFFLYERDTLNVGVLWLNQYVTFLIS